MKLIALDSSSEMCSAALLTPDGLLTTDAVVGHGHSERLLPMLQGLLAEAGLGLRDLDGIAFGAGPGSFTGLRIACGVAQGLALGADLPVLGVGTLDALALEAGQGAIVAALDARMGEVYALACRVEGDCVTPVWGPLLSPPQSVPALPGEGWQAAGIGFDAYAEALCATLGDLPRLPARYPHARAILRLAAPRFAAGEGGAAESAQPFYLRDKVALKICER
jgi:tRNA threonylcarbamoyladenosine biosynthesis protein TsaB